jgi:methylenetetrahydrofolate dehydrogenase (NADP+)/methenyltetrahydrofolate cyclohydrolase
MSPARRLDGKATAGRIRERIHELVASRPEGEPPPRLVMIRVGEDPASVVYVRNKEKACAQVGLRSAVLALPEDTSQERLLEQVRELNRDPDVDGFLVQLPLPGELDPVAVQEAMDPAKDVDGLHPWNAGRLALGRPALVPCTPLGIQALLEDHGIDVAGRRVVIVGRSNIVGRPLAQLLSLKGVDATVTIAHSRTPDLARVTREAEILVVAAGRPRFVTAEMVRPGAVVVDVGIHRLPGEGKPRLVGDVEADGVAAVAAALSPVPGGVGPMTVAMLLANALWAAARRRGWPGVPPPWELWKRPSATGGDRPSGRQGQRG